MFDQLIHNSLWRYKLYGNTLEDYLLALGTLLLIFFILEIVHKLIIGWATKITNKTKNKLDDFIVLLVNKVGPSTYAWFATYSALQTLTISRQVTRINDLLMIIWAAVIIINLIEKIINYVLSRHIDKDAQAKSFLRAMSILTKVVLWIFGGIMILSNLGVNATSLITGLGVGGIAVAFAAQNIFTDLFSSFSIYLDKPFKVGDYITSGTESGFVKKIGIKTTRIEGPTGQVIIISNQELVKARVQNFHKLQERQVKISLNIQHQTTSAQVQALLQDIQKLIEATPKTKFLRANFTNITDYSLQIDTVYAVIGSDYDAYLKTHQAINFGIKNILESSKIKLAYPTQSISLLK